MDEPVDRNKSAITHAATATAAAWLAGLGCKPIETEVSLCDGWIADLASFWEPTCTEAKRGKLLKALIPDNVARDTHQQFAHLCRSFGSRFTICVEVKTSRPDFMGDIGRKYGVFSDGKKRPATLKPPAHLCVLAYTGAIKRPDEHLINWASLRLSEDGSRVIKFDGAWSGNAQWPHQVEELIAQVAIRRDHHTRYQGIRRWLKSYRAGHALMRERVNP